MKIKKLKKLKGKGHTDKEIGKMLGTSHGSVSKKWERLKVTYWMIYHSNYFADMKEITTKNIFFKSQENAIETSVWTKEDDEELLKWVKRFGGKNWGQVAEKLRRSKDSVCGRYNK